MKEYKEYYKVFSKRIDINEMVKDFHVDLRFSHYNRWDVVNTMVTIISGNEMTVRSMPAVVYEFDSSCYFDDSSKVMPIKVLIPVWEYKDKKEIRMAFLVEQMMPPYKRFVYEKLGRIDDIKICKELEDQIREFHCKREEGSGEHEQTGQKS